MNSGTVADWLDFFPDTVTIYAYTGVSVSGQPAYSATGVGYAARIEMGNRIVKDGTGKDVVSRGLIVLGTTVAPGIMDKLVLPVGNVPVNPPIIVTNPVSDQFGIHHIEVYVG